MILQAYDFFHLCQYHDCSLQIGGADQWGNIICGMELNRRALGRETYALTVPLMTTASGAKMGKSEGGAIWVNADRLSDFDYFQFWRNTDDRDVIRFLKMYTNLPLDDIAVMESWQGADLNKAKVILAFEATKLCRGELAAIQARTAAEQTFSGAGIDNLPSYDVASQRIEQGYYYYDLLVDLAWVDSKSEARRLFKGQGAKLNDQYISEMQKIQLDDFKQGFAHLSLGKKKHLKLQLQA